MVEEGVQRMSDREGARTLQKFQRGDEAYIRMTFQNVVPIQDAWVTFVHEEDVNEHIRFGIVARDAE